MLFIVPGLLEGSDVVRISLGSSWTERKDLRGEGATLGLTIVAVKKA